MMDESDLEPEVPHALLVRLNQVRAVRLPLLHYAEEDEWIYNAYRM